MFNNMFFETLAPEYLYVDSKIRVLGLVVSIMRNISGHFQEIAATPPNTKSEMAL